MTASGSPQNKSRNKGQCPPFFVGSRRVARRLPLGGQKITQQTRGNARHFLGGDSARGSGVVVVVVLVVVVVVVAVGDSESCPSRPPPGRLEAYEEE